MTDRASLLSTVQSTLPQLDTLNLETMCAAMHPILSEWMDAMNAI